MKCEGCPMVERRLSEGQIKAACLALDRVVGLMVIAECGLTWDDLKKIREKNLKRRLEAMADVEEAEEIENRFAKMERGRRN